VFGLQSLLGAYVEQGAEVLRCPADDTSQPYSYAFNLPFAGRVLRQIEAAERTVLLYEGDDRELYTRHNNGLNIACADGQVHWISESSIENCFWEPR